MKFSTKEDITAPIDRVFAEVSEFGTFERALLRRGIEVERVDKLTEPAVGMTWKSRFPYRGKTRELVSELVGFEAPERLAIQTEMTGLDGWLSLELVPLSLRQTRMAVQLELKPRTLPARLMLQTLRLSKARLTRRFKSGVGSYCRDLEARIGQGVRRV